MLFIYTFTYFVVYLLLSKAICINSLCISRLFYDDGKFDNKHSSWVISCIAKVTRVNFNQNSELRTKSQNSESSRDPKSVDFATQVLKKVNAWNFLVHLIQLILAIGEPFLSRTSDIILFRNSNINYPILHMVAIFLLEKVIVDARIWTYRLVQQINHAFPFRDS